MKKDIDLSLYLVTDRELSLGRTIEDTVRAAVSGGVTIVQLREKHCSTREFLELAINLKKILQDKNIPLIINDRLDIALASGADGIHIGQSDMPYEIARKYLGSDAIIGLSVENIEQVESANNLDVDYIGISPVFSTPTKTDTQPPFGLDGVSKACKKSRHPAVAIGGINKTNASDIIKAGADGIAVVSAIVSSPDQEASARELMNIVRATRGENEAF